MLSAQAGSKIVIALYTATVIAGFLCFLLFGRAYLATYTALSGAGAFCGFLITRFIVSKARFTFENKISGRRNIYFSRGIFVGIASLWGVGFSITHNDLNGFSLIAALLLGAELGEFRKMQRITNGENH